MGERRASCEECAPQSAQPVSPSNVRPARLSHHPYPANVTDTVPSPLGLRAGIVRWRGRGWEGRRRSRRNCQSEATSQARLVRRKRRSKGGRWSAAEISTTFWPISASRPWQVARYHPPASRRSANRAPSEAGGGFLIFSRRTEETCAAKNEGTYFFLFGFRG